MINTRRICSSIGLTSRFSSFLLILALSVPVQAQDWRFSPEIAVGYEFDDNARLTTRTDDVIELNGLLAEASADIEYLSETSEFGFTPLIRQRTYQGDPEFDATEVDARLRYSLETIKNTWRIDGRFNRAPVRNAERVDDDLGITDPDNIPDDDSGLVQLGGDRDRLNIRPSWSHRWSNVSSTRVTFDYRDVSYDEVFVFLRPYTDAVLAVDYRHRFTANTVGFVAGGWRNYEDDNANEFDSFAVNFGINTQVTPKLQIRARAGAEEVKDDVTGISETVPVGELTFIRRLETIRLLAQYRRSVSSTGSGRMTERDAVNVNFTRDLTEKFEAGLGIRGYQSAPIDLSGRNLSGFKREFLQLTAIFTWNITRTFALRTSYRYTMSNREIEAESANSNQIVAWLIFRPTGIRDER